MRWTTSTRLFTIAVCLLVFAFIAATGGSRSVLFVVAALVIGGPLQAIVILKVAVVDEAGRRWDELSPRDRFRVWRAVRAGVGVDDPHLAEMAVAYAKQQQEQHHPWSRRWLRSWLNDPLLVVGYLAFSIELLVAWLHPFTVGIAAVTLVLLLRFEKRGSVRMAERAETANSLLRGYAVPSGGFGG